MSRFLKALGITIGAFAALLATLGIVVLFLEFVDRFFSTTISGLIVGAVVGIPIIFWISYAELKQKEEREKRDIAFAERLDQTRRNMQDVKDQNQDAPY